MECQCRALAELHTRSNSAVGYKCRGMWRRHRGWLACAGAVALSLLAVSPAGARSGLVFAGAKPISISWGQVVAGKRLKFCNGSGKPARQLAAVVGGFGFKPPQKRQPRSAMVELESPKNREIPAGGCGVLTLRAVPGAKLKPGTYTGAVVVTARGAGVARLGVAVTRAGPKEPAAVSGAMEEATLELVNAAPVGPAGSQRVGNLLLTAPPEAQRPLPLGQECEKPDAGEAWDDKACPLIGNLYQGSSIVHVFMAGKVIEGEGVEELPVRISADQHLVGDFEGELDPSGSGEDEQMVKTKLTASDSWVWAVLAVILGAGIAILLQLLAERCRPRFLLERRRRGIVAAYRRAHRWDPKNRKITVDLDTAMTYAETVREAIGRYMGSVLIVDTASEAYREIDASIALAEKDAETLLARDGLRAGLDGLEAEVVKARKMLATTYEIKETPAMLARAAAPLTEGSLSVGEATERGKDARELTPLLREWRQLAKRVLLYEVWLIALSAKAKKTSSKWPKKDKEALAEAAIRQADLRTELFAASKGADLERLSGSFRIEAIVAELSDLGGRHGIGIPEDPEATLKTASTSLLAPVKEAFPELAERAPEATPEGVNWSEWEIDATSAAPARLPQVQHRLLLLDVFVLVGGATTAIVAALAAFYFGKTFGGIEDYLTVIFSATLLQALIKVVMDKFEVFMHDVSTEKGVVQPTTKIAPKPT